MRVPLSWLKEYVDITIGAEELAERLTLAGLEVASIEYVGVPQGVAPAGITVPPSDHLVWDREKILLGAIMAVFILWRVFGWFGSYLFSNVDPVYLAHAVSFVAVLTSLTVFKINNRFIKSLATFLTIVGLSLEFTQILNLLKSLI